ncbi:MAG TPA: hypothetical protein VLS89_20810 [Candidatus Nanopelagicales bacterium]|nr:hypothetical protein [Candidatus Nanopelagicales bacterium]
MVLSIKHAALALAVSMGALAGACGPSMPPPDGPPAGGATPPGEQTPPAPGEGAAPGDATKPNEPAPGAASPAKSRDLTATAMEAELKKIGLNLQKLPELEKMTLAQKKKVMPLLQKSLGMESCQGCHVEGDFKKETRDMKVAREMWRHFVVPLRTEQGGAVFCDSCHGGKEHVLARADKKAVEAFMEDQYEHKLTLADKSDMECSTCHGDTMELKIIEKLWNIPKG